MNIPSSFIAHVNFKFSLKSDVQYFSNEKNPKLINQENICQNKGQLHARVHTAISLLCLVHLRGLCCRCLSHQPANAR